MLKSYANEARKFETAYDFAIYIGVRLNQFYKRYRISNKEYSGLGIHFSAYENVDGIHIPELFTIRNFKGTDSTALLPSGFEVSRNNYCILPIEFKVPQKENDDNSKECRLAVRSYLESGRLLFYNNGDPDLSSQAIISLLNMAEIAKKRKILKEPQLTQTYRQLAIWVVDSVSEFQTRLIKDGKQIVGGKRHNLSITPKGIPESDTGDV